MKLEFLISYVVILGCFISKHNTDSLNNTKKNMVSIERFLF